MALAPSGSHTLAARTPAGPGLRWALMFGNFVIGCGVMSAAGTLNDIARSFAIPIPLAGQLISSSAVTMAIGAPLLALWVAGFDRRRLLAFALVWYGAGHAVCASMPSFAGLMSIRALTAAAAAIYTPQAAAAIGFMAAPEDRGRAITFIFLGWSVASVLGMPVSAWIGQTFGWRAAFSTIASLSIMAGAWVWVELPDGVRPEALSRQAWKAVLSHPVLMAIVSVTALFGAAQFTLFAYLTPYFQLQLGASTGEIAGLLTLFGGCGLLGNLLLTRTIDRVGASAAVMAAMALIGLALLLWPLGVGVLGCALILMPWGLGCFAANSAQQARLGIVAPTLAPALLALNTSAIYVGQAAGAASGGWLIAHRQGFSALPAVGLGWIVCAMAVSFWAGSQQRKMSAS